MSRPLRLMFRMRRTPAADVDDLVQETLLVVLRRLRRELPDDPNGVQAFAEATARNLSIGEVRKRTRREELLKMAGETLSPAPELPPEPAWSASETARLVRQSLEQLGQPRDQMILREHYFNGIDKASLCARHGMSSAHFDRILFNARKRLRKLLRLRGIAEAP
ncbi:MAG: sigma-70 family RNA polymerase sigma factor [Rhodanobacteraceae bacterium]|nr:sigma-70 family RNA polymerase sigma factor [Rhodanobacteraceae bacterium]